MITSFKVGAIFQIVDEATPTVTRITREVNALATAAERAKVALSSITRIGTSGMAAGIAAANAELRAGVANANAYAAAMARAVSAGRGLPAAGGGRGGRHGPGGGGVHISSLGTSVPGGHARIGGSNAAMLGGGALALGVYQEAQLEDAAFRLMFTAGAEPSGPMLNDERFKKIRSVIQSSAAKTGFPLHDVEEALLASTRQMGGFTFDQRMEVLPGILEASAAEAKLKETSLKEATESMVGLIHMTGTYDPEKIKALASSFAYASIISPVNLQGIERAASYAVPTLQAGLGMDPGKLLTMIAAMQSAGVLNTKSGTWMREGFTRLFPGTSLISQVAHKKQIGALKQLGLVDEHAKPLFTDEKGVPDPIKVASMVNTGLNKIPQEDRAAVLRQAFGAQGSAFWTLMQTDAMRERLPKLLSDSASFKAGPEFLKHLGEESPVMQARQAWAETQNVLMDIGAQVLPGLLAGLKEFDGILKSISGALPKPSGGGTSSIGKRMAEGAVAGGILGGVPTGGLGWIPGAAVGAITGAAFGYVEDHWPKGNGKAQLGAAGFEEFMGANNGGVKTMNVTVKAETDNPEALADAVAGKLSGILAGAAQHNQGEGEGALSSPWNSGTGYP